MDPGLHAAGPGLGLKLGLGQELGRSMSLASGLGRDGWG
jgi:hypothetical protein